LLDQHHFHQIAEDIVMETNTPKLQEEWIKSATAVADLIHMPIPSVARGPLWLMMGNPALTDPRGNIWMHPKVLGVPEDIRQYLLAHEMGHALHRHGKVAFLAFVILVTLYAVSPVLCAWIGWAYILAVLVPYGLGDRAEFQADVTAVKVLGSPYAVIRAQQEVMAVMGESITPRRERRWRKLRALAQT
jgi:hypothetical protein